MSIRFLCTNCNATLELPDGYAGQIVECSECSNRFEVPENDVVVVATASTDDDPSFETSPYMKGYIANRKKENSPDKNAKLFGQIVVAVTFVSFFGCCLWFIASPKSNSSSSADMVAVSYARHAIKRIARNPDSIEVSIWDTSSTPGDNGETIVKGTCTGTNAFGGTVQSRWNAWVTSGGRVKKFVYIDSTGSHEL